MIKIAKSGHTLDVRRTEKSFSSLPNFVPEKYSVKYIVRNWDENGSVFFYIARCTDGQYHVWYRNSSAMWTSYGETIQKAIDGAQRDGWMYA